jgi:hypothetical protein
MEAGVVIDKEGQPIHWHVPPGRTAGSLPDSRQLWHVLWTNRERLLGIAHSHAGQGEPGPSWEDVTTFSALELALGRRLDWWITSADAVVVMRWVGPEKYAYRTALLSEEPAWVAHLRELSNEDPRIGPSKGGAQRAEE